MASPSSPARSADDPLARVAALPGVDDAAAAARAAVDKLLANRMLRRRSAEISVEAALRSARASAALEGADIPLETLRAHGSADPIVQGTLRVNAELGSLRETFPRSPHQALARLHLLAAADLVPADDLGRPRIDGQPARDTGVLGEPPLAGEGLRAIEVSARLDGLARVLAAPTSAPAAVVAAVLHAELLTLRPFSTANGVVARAAARLVLLTRGLDPKALTAPDVGHAEQAAEYAAAAAAYASGDPEGVARFVRHCCEALELGARESLAVCEAMARG